MKTKLTQRRIKARKASARGLCEPLNQDSADCASASKIASLAGIRPEGASLLACMNTPESRIESALDELYGAASKGDATALQAYARILCKHAGQLNGLVPDHAEKLLPFSRHQLCWPILKSTRKCHSENERQILDTLEIGEDCGEAIHRDRRYRLNGKLAWLVSESLRFVELHRQTADGGHHYFSPMQLSSLREDFPGRVLQKYGSEAQLRAALKAGRLTADTVGEWELFVVTAFKAILERRKHRPADIGWLKHYVSKSKARSFGRAKEQFLRLLSKRIRSVAGKKLA